MKVTYARDRWEFRAVYPGREINGNREGARREPGYYQEGITDGCFLSSRRVSVTMPSASNPSSRCSCF